MSHKFILKKLEPFQNPVPKRGWFCNDFDVAKANRQIVFRLGFQTTKTMQTAKNDTNKSQKIKQILRKISKRAAVGIYLLCHGSITTTIAQAVKPVRSHSSIYQTKKATKVNPTILKLIVPLFQTNEAQNNKALFKSPCGKVETFTLKTPESTHFPK